MAPAHIVHGSRVTTMVWPSSRQPPTARAAARMATISACAVGSASASRLLCPRAITAPAASRITAPTGTSPALAAAAASASATRMNAVYPWGGDPPVDPVHPPRGYVECTLHQALGRSPKLRLAMVSTASSGYISMSLDMAAEVHLVQPEVGEDGKVARGEDLVDVLLIRDRDVEVLKDGDGQRVPLGGGGDVGQQHRDLAADQPHRDEEIIGHASEPDGAGNARLLAQGAEQAIQVLRQRYRQHVSIPAVVLPVDDDGKVCVSVSLTSGIAMD